MKAMKAARLMRTLQSKPLEYTVTRQNGSHRRLESANGFPPLTFSFHDSRELSPNEVRKVLCKDIGLSESIARGLL